MKSVGKQLQEARLAKDWTPELAARETKIKVDRLRDLEKDDYSHFTSPTYARGFVRTYARALGLDEYKILRQLDNKLPDDDSANIVTDTGVAYLPETAMPPRAAHRDYTGLYIVTALGGVVALIITVVLFEAYRVGELSSWFSSNPDNVATTPATGTNANVAVAAPGTEAPARALPVDSNTPPPIVDANAATNAAAIPVAAVATDTNSPPRALPVDPSELGTSAPPAADAAVQAPRALPVDPSELTNAAPVAPVPAQTADTSAPPVAPRALPVDPSELTNATTATPATGTNIALNTIPPSPTAVVIPPADPAPANTDQPPVTTSSARQSNSGPVMEPSLPAVQPSAETAPAVPAPVAPVATPAPDASTNAAPQTSSPPATPAGASTDSDKRLVLTASQDSFVRVTNLDAPDSEKSVYAAVLHSGESVGFDGHKFAINVGVPSAVDIKLDGVNYGPHSDQDEPETFTVQSHLP
jgi:cytoskeletal protein RodZ